MSDCQGLSSVGQELENLSVPRKQVSQLPQYQPTTTTFHGKSENLEENPSKRIGHGEERSTHYTSPHQKTEEALIINRTNQKKVVFLGVTWGEREGWWLGERSSDLKGRWLEEILSQKAMQRKGSGIYERKLARGRLRKKEGGVCWHCGGGSCIYHLLFCLYLFG